MICSINVVAPESVDQGGAFTVQFSLKNVSAEYQTFKTEFFRDAVLLDTKQKSLSPNEAVTYSITLTMGPSDTELFIWVEMLKSGSWLYVNAATKTVKVIPTDPQYTGELLDVWVNKAPEGSKMSIPAVVGADGNAFEVYADFKNTSSYSYIVGCKVIVWDPNGNTHAPATDRANINPGQTLYNWGPFQFPAVNITGKWMISVQYLLDNGVVVDSLGPVVCLDVPGRTGQITSQWVNKGAETYLPMPASVSADGQTFEIGVEWKNTWNANYDARIEMVTRYPDYSIAKSLSSTYYGMTPGMVLDKTFNIAAVDKAGSWTVAIRLVTRDGEELARYDGACLIAAGPTGVITARWFNQGSHSEVPFSTQIDADGQPLEVGARFKSTTEQAIDAGIQVEVWAPDGIQQPTPAVDYPAFGIGYNQEITSEYQFGPIDKVGEWSARVTIITRDGDILDEWPGEGKKGLLLKAIPVAEFSDLSITSFMKKSDVGGTAAAGLSPITVEPGDAILVDVSFKYSAPSGMEVTLTGALHILPGVDYEISTVVPIAAGTDKTWTGVVEIPINDVVGLRNYTYHLMVRLPDYGLIAQIDDAVTCTGMPEGVWQQIGGIAEMVGMLVTVMIVGIMMDMMTSQEGFLATGAKYVERGKEVAAPIIQIFTGKSE